jgi:hypothetical protein
LKTGSTMDDSEAGKAGQQAPHRSPTLDDSPAARRRERGLRGIAWAQITRHGRLSKLSVTKRRQALAQWLQGMQP